jgi:hypothetical protein
MVYELLVDARLCKFEATSMDERRFRFKAAACEAITDELGLVDWHGRFSPKGVDLCVDIFYDVLVLKYLCREPQRVVRRNFHG